MNIEKLKEYIENGARSAAKMRDDLDPKKWPSSRGFQDGRVDALLETLELIKELEL
jgi:hypothetical protein